MIGNSRVESLRRTGHLKGLTHIHCLGLTRNFTHRQFVGVYKILFYFEAHVHESIISLLPPPTRIARTIARPLHDYRAIYDPLRPPCVCHTPYNVGHGNIV